MNNTVASRRIRLTDGNVTRILNRCIIPEGVPVVGYTTVEVEGIHKDFVFNSSILDTERQHIEEMLKQLPKGFKQGRSFGEMYRTESGRQWTGNIKNMEALMVLGAAIGKVKYPVPKSLWWSLPGGMPYVVVK